MCLSSVVMTIILIKLTAILAIKIFKTKGEILLITWTIIILALDKISVNFRMLQKIFLKMIFLIIIKIAISTIKITSTLMIIIITIKMIIAIIMIMKIMITSIITLILTKHLVLIQEMDKANLSKLWVSPLQQKHQLKMGEGLQQLKLYINFQMVLKRKNSRNTQIDNIIYNLLTKKSFINHIFV